MSLANFQRNVILGVRDNNFKIADEKGLSIEENPNHIELVDNNGKLIETFFGHISLSEFLKEL